MLGAFQKFVQVLQPHFQSTEYQGVWQIKSAARFPRQILLDAAEVALLLVVPTEVCCSRAARGAAYR